MSIKPLFDENSILRKQFKIYSSNLETETLTTSNLTVDELILNGLGNVAQKINQNTSNISQNSSYINQNSSNILQNQNNISNNTSNISQNSNTIITNSNHILQNTNDINNLENKTQNINLANTTAGETYIDGKLFVDGELITEDTEIHLGENVYANNQTASEIVLIGRNAGASGVSNSTIAIGTGACKSGAGTLSTTVGRLACELSPPGIGAIVIGNSASRQNTAGVCSVVIGCEAQNASALTNGQKYVCIGNQSGRAGVGSGAVVIGDRAGEGLAVPANSIVIAAKLNSGATVANSNEMKFVAGSNEFNYNGTDINFTNTITANKGNLNIASINNKTITYGQWSQLGNLDIPLTATGTEFDLTGSGVGTLTIPFDEMVAGGSWHVKLAGTLNTNDKDDITFKTYWIDPLAVQADQLIFDSGAIELADTGAANQQWEYEFDFTIRQAGSNAIMYSNNQLIYSKGNTENSGRIVSKWQNTTGLDMTYNQNWKFTVEWNTSLQPHTIINRMVRIQKVF